MKALITADWVVGFADGEGSFTTRINKRAGSARTLAPFVPALKFDVSQADDVILNEIRGYFGGIGKVTESKRYKGNFLWRVHRIDEVQMIRDFFIHHPLRTKKQQLRFKLWSEILDIILRKEHLTYEGLMRIAELREKMNSIGHLRLGRLKYKASDLKKAIDLYYSYRPKNWSANEIEFLQEFHQKKSIREIAQSLNRSEDSVFGMVRMLGLSKQRLTSWTPEDIAFLRRNYRRKNAKKIAKDLGRTVHAVHRIASELGIRQRMHWRLNEIAFLKENYSKMKIRDIAQRLGRTGSAVQYMAGALKLKKST